MALGKYLQLPFLHVTTLHAILSSRSNMHFRCRNKYPDISKRLIFKHRLFLNIYSFFCHSWVSIFILLFLFLSHFFFPLFKILFKPSSFCLLLFLQFITSEEYNLWWVVQRTGEGELSQLDRGREQYCLILTALWKQ